jgi:hypothetical protein
MTETTLSATALQKIWELPFLPIEEFPPKGIIPKEVEHLHSLVAAMIHSKAELMRFSD